MRTSVETVPSNSSGMFSRLQKTRATKNNQNKNPISILIPKQSRLSSKTSTQMKTTVTQMEMRASRMKTHPGRQKMEMRGSGALVACRRSAGLYPMASTRLPMSRPSSMRAWLAAACTCAGRSLAGSLAGSATLSLASRLASSKSSTIASFGPTAARGQRS